jgi:drug/metabolite transporter (DMT)-like permease
MNKNPQIYFLLCLTAIFGLIATHFYLDILKDTSAVLITALFSSYPLVTAAAGYLFLNEVISRQQFIGMVVIIAGVILMNIGDFDY